MLRALTFAVALGLALPALAGPWDVPPEGSCAPTGGLRGWPPGADAPPVPFAPGDVIDLNAFDGRATFRSITLDVRAGLPARFVVAETPGEST